ncbi:winged helix-turn-helix domain-containing protein [Victivallis lenta]|uniref:winged helix-turn-helix domain-containing protein n=1 Tax=Victivallis lenta TaxID=2606640 RepID=UPI003AB2E7B3
MGYPEMSASGQPATYSYAITLQELSKYLKKWNSTPQKTISRTYQRDEVRVMKWLNEEYPAIEAKAQ